MPSPSGGLPRGASTLVPSQLSLVHHIRPLYKVISSLIHLPDWKYVGKTVHWHQCIPHNIGYPFLSPLQSIVAILNLCPQGQLVLCFQSFTDRKIVSSEITKSNPSVSIDLNLLYHEAAGQNGSTTMPLHLSIISFCNTLPTNNI